VDTRERVFVIVERCTSHYMLSPTVVMGTENASANSICICQAASHESDHRDVDLGLAVFGIPLVVLAVPAVLGQPGKRGFDDPPGQQHDGSFRSERQ